LRIKQITKPYKKQRYPTVGDYIYDLDSDKFEFMIAKMKNTDYEALIFIHEFIEAYLCWKAKIKEEDISAFDIQFEEEGRGGEPGDDPEAPYFEYHQLAGKIEKIFSRMLGVDWYDYDKACADLYWGNK
jgi:hypothetical protein